MRRRIPPLNPLHVFESAARLGNLTRAAEELGVTQSAVSRQIATLESYLGAPLFHRERTGVVLSPPGREYWESIGPAFQAIHEATERMRQRGAEQPLRLLVYPTFAVKWLIPRLHDFSARHPSADISIATGTRPVDFTRDRVDLAIQLLPDDPRPENAVLLFADILQPVASAGFLALHAAEKVPDLRSLPRLMSRYRRDDWRDWSSRQSPDCPLDGGVEFPSSVLTYEAAVEGLGVAIGQVQLLDRDFAAGRLVRLHEPVTRPMSYYLLRADRTEPRGKARTFANWLEKTAHAHVDRLGIHSGSP